MFKKLALHFLKGILAGIAIGTGGFLFVMMTYFLKNDLGKAIGSILFSVGLFTVCFCYLSLYTGKIGMVFEKKQEKEFYFALPIMLVGNFIGACFIGYLTHIIFKETDVMLRAVEVAESRIVYSSFSTYLNTFIKAIFCGLCVYLAVKSFAANRMKFVGIFLLVFFVFLFVYAGFEHCIANMFYFSFGNRWTWNSLFNILIVILGNSVGTIPGVMLIELFNGELAAHKQEK